MAFQALGFAILTEIASLEVFVQLVLKVSRALRLLKIALLSCVRLAPAKD